MSLVDDITRYYAERAPVYDQTAGYADPVAEELRAPIRARWGDMLRGRTVLEVACGTGYWTRAIAQTAYSVLAFDINPMLVRRARARCRDLSNVTIRIADAYAFEGIPGGFTAALGIWWWSHVPRERLRAFLGKLHGRLQAGALVLFVDQLPYGGVPAGGTLRGTESSPAPCRMVAPSRS
jgi:demethylmenaquinone methyltransferase/2-methoxy-6-polyprenyl-1,4-benzoquinol methylase